MFCPKCGSKDVVDVLCARCLKEEKPLISSIKDVTAEVCTGCKKFHYKGSWQQGSPQERLAAAIADRLVPPLDARIENIEVEQVDVPLKTGLKVEGTAVVQVTGAASSKAKSYTETYDIPYVVQNTLCPRCRKLGGQYFEATIQLRNEHEQALALFKDLLKEYRATVAKTRKQRNGTDYYVSHKRAAQRIVQQMQHRFGGLVKRSATLFGYDKQRSKDVHRVTFYLELPFFQQGDVVTDGEAPLVVRELGKQIKCFDLRRQKNVMREYSPEWQSLPLFNFSVKNNKTLHPETFQEVELARPVEDGEHDGTLFNDRVYAIPA